MDRCVIFSTTKFLDLLHNELRYTVIRWFSILHLEVQLHCSDPCFCSSRITHLSHWTIIGFPSGAAYATVSQVPQLLEVLTWLHGFWKVLSLTFWIRSGFLCWAVGRSAPLFLPAPCLVPAESWWILHTHHPQSIEFNPKSLSLRLTSL